MAQVDTQARRTARSYVRVKALVLLGVFLGCGVALRFQSRLPDELLFAVAALSAVLVYFIRCERCHSSIYYRAGGKRVLLHGASSLAILASRRCPCCDLERI